MRGEETLEPYLGYPRYHRTVVCREGASMGWPGVVVERWKEGGGRVVPSRAISFVHLQVW